MSKVTFKGASLSKNVSVLKSSTAIPPISYSFELVFTLDNPNPYDGYASASDNFGAAGATSNTYTIVGAPLEDAATGINSGAAYIFSNATGQLLHTLTNPNAYGVVANDYFGTSVAINETYAAVGASGDEDAGGSSSGKVYIYSAATGELIYTLANPSAYGTSAGDGFGNAIEMSSDYIIVCANGEDDASGTSSGKAYVYSLSNGQLLYTFNNPNATGTSTNDSFGISVSITNTHAIVGAHQEDVGGSASGSAYIFSLSNGQLLYTLNNPNGYSTAATDYFGRAVGISSNYAVVGAYGEDDAGGLTSGKAYIYSLSNGQLVRTINNPNPVSTSANDNFAFYLDVSDTHVVFSAHQEGTITGDGAGKAYVYELSTGSRIYTLNNPNDYGTPNADYFSQFSVSLSNNYIMVAAISEDSISGGTVMSSTGRVYVYSATTGQLLYTLTHPNAFGSSSDDAFSRYAGLSTSSMYTVVGAADEDDVLKSGNGKAYIFSNSTGQLLVTLDNPVSPTTGTASFGKGVANTNNYVAIGAPGYNMYGLVYIYNPQGELLRVITSPMTANTTMFGATIDMTDTHLIVGAYNTTDGGKAYIYSTTTGELLYTLNNPNAYSTAASDYFGFSVAITDNYAIVGAYQEDDASGTNSGKAYIYSTSTGALLHTLNNPTPYGTSASDNFGYSVGISGNYAIVGAPLEDGSATDNESGKAYIYSATTGALVYTLDNPNAYSTGQFDYFGDAVAISENYAIVGAYSEKDAAGTGGAGKAYIFSLTNGQLAYTLDNPNPVGASTSDFVGKTVNISTNHAAVGAWGEEDQNGYNSGKVYLYTLP